MGWSYMHRARGLTDREFFQGEFGKTFVATGSKNGTFYAAIEVDAATAPGLVPNANGKAVIAIVVLMKRTRGEFNFGYKDMDEFMGPVVAECPAKVLDVLSPIKPEACFTKSKGNTWNGLRWAAEWRAACRAGIAKRVNRLKLKEGMRVRLPNPVRFSNGLTPDVFYVTKRGKQFVFSYYGSLYRLTREMQETLIASPMPERGVT